jgi:hypothetical protein
MSKDEDKSQNQEILEGYPTMNACLCFIKESRSDVCDRNDRLGETRLQASRSMKQRATLGDPVRHN